MGMVKVRFYDHSWGSSFDPSICTVTGEICEEFSDKTFVVIRVWKMEAEDGSFDPLDKNQEYATLVRSAIIEMSHLIEVSDVEVVDCAEA